MLGLGLGVESRVSIFFYRDYTGRVRCGVCSGFRERGWGGRFGDYGVFFLRKERIIGRF